MLSLLSRLSQLSKQTTNDANAELRVGLGYLPVELTNAIIDIFRHDRQTLRACALVSQAWRFRAQSHLFRTLEITTRAAVYKLESIIKQSPHIADAVRSLELRCSIRTGPHPTESIRARWPILRKNVDIDTNWLPCAFSVLGLYLSRVTTLTLSHWTVDQKPHPESFLHTGFPAVTHLVINAVKFESASELYAALEARPNLFRVEFGFLWAKEFASTATLSLPQMKHLELHMEGNTASSLVPAFTKSTCGITQLRNLRLSSISTLDAVQAAIPLIQAVTPHIEGLWLDFRNRERVKTVTDALKSASAAMCLQSLILQFLTYRVEVSTELIASMRPTGLRELTIHLSNHGAQHQQEQGEAWSTIANVVTEQCPQLARLVVTVQEGRNCEENLRSATQSVLQAHAAPILYSSNVSLVCLDYDSWWQQNKYWNAHCTR